jgi:hypothetical protein
MTTKSKNFDNIQQSTKIVDTNLLFNTIALVKTRTESSKIQVFWNISAQNGKVMATNLSKLPSHEAKSIVFAVLNGKIANNDSISGILSNKKLKNTTKIYNFNDFLSFIPVNQQDYAFIVKNLDANKE